MGQGSGSGGEKAHRVGPGQTQHLGGRHYRGCDQTEGSSCAREKRGGRNYGLATELLADCSDMSYNTS